MPYKTTETLRLRRQSSIEALTADNWTIKKKWSKPLFLLLYKYLIYKLLYIIIRGFGTSKKATVNCQLSDCY